LTPQEVYAAVRKFLREQADARSIQPAAIASGDDERRRCVCVPIPVITDDDAPIDAGEASWSYIEKA
jgi:hypothetical protein